jgi:hypothetical protein
VLAQSGDTCNVAGTYATTANGAIAGQATGLNALITGPSEGTVIFSTAGASANALQADNGGAISLTPTLAAPATVTTTGVGSVGLLATGSALIDDDPVPSQITIQNVNVSTSGAAVLNGPTVNGIEIDDGAIANITNGSVTTTATANGAVGVSATGGGQVTISGTTINSNANGSQGLFVTGSGSSLSGSTLNITASGNMDPVTGFYSGAASNNAFGEFAAGGTLSLSNSILTTTGTQSFGVYTANAGVTTLSNDNITIMGDNALAVESAAGGLTTINSGSVTTQGTNSIGAYATGAGSAITANTGVAIKTSGTDSFGVQADSGGQVTLNGGSVMTSGIGSTGLYATAAGSSITATGVAVATSGNFDPSTNSSSNGLDVEDGARAVFSGGSISTAGNGAYAVVAESKGSISLSGTTIGTIGNGSGGLGINGSGSEIDAAGVTIATTGTMDPVTGLHSYGVYNGPYGDFTSGGVAKLTDTSISTQGVQMYGVITSTGGTTSILGGSIATAGTQANGVLAENGGTVAIGVSNSEAGATSVVTSGTSAPGVVAYVGGAVQITGATIATNGDGSSGLSLNGAGSSITATGISVTTRGGVDTATGDHADGAFNGPYPPGGVTSGGFLSIANSTVATSGASADGVVTSTGGTTTISGGSVTTSGVGAYAIAVNGGGAVTLNGTTISTTANGSGGFSVEGAGSTLTASGVSVTTQGAFDPISGDHSYGLYNGPSGTITSGGAATLTDTTISTQGADMHGVVTGAGGSTTLIGTNLSTAGPGANGVFTNAGGVTNINGGSVNTAGQDAHALFVTGLGSQGNLGGAGTFATTGAGAIGFYAALGGAISATASTMITIATSGGVSLATGLGAYGVNADGVGSSIKLGSATIMTSGAGATGLYASDRAASGAAGTISAIGRLNVQTKNASAAAVALQGNGATIAATGGGTISAAGTAIAFLGGTGQSATFDNFAIGNLSGDLVFADPSIATLNFNNTTANAGNNNLLNATAGSAFTLNANASMLTGAIRTDATSTTNVDLTNNTTWNLIAASTVTNLNVTHSIIVFAPPGAAGAFKTLTVNNYAGNGANITMNVALSGANSASDQIIINGGKAKGSTLLTINNVGGVGGQTSGNGIPLIIVTNGGSVASGAFSLANTPMVGGFKYTLEETDNSYFLVSSPTATIAGVTNSVNSVAKAQQSQMITNRVLGSILLGATQQISCSSCGGGFASIGSFALGGSGRWSLSDTTTLIGGISYDQWSASGITVNNAPTVAGALVYDFVKWGSSRPFVEVGAGLTPYEQVSYSRTYPNGATTGTGYASATNRDASLFGRVGWVDRLTPIDEAAAYVDLGRSWMQTGGYSEQMTAVNPFPATVPNGLAALNTARLGTQYTHLFNGNIEVNIGGAVAYGFGAGAGAPFNVSEFGTIGPGAIADSAWFEYGARVGYRVTDRLVVDAFLLGTAGGLAGNFVHGGVGVRYSF